MFDLDVLRKAVADHGPVARVVIADVKGSSPREVGAAMLVWAGGQAGTIGGGALEWQAATRARAMLGAGGTRLVLPAPGSATTTTARCEASALRTSSRRSSTGR